MTAEDGRSTTRVLARSVARCVLFGSAVIVTWWLGESAAAADESIPVPADTEVVAVPASPTVVAPTPPIVVAPVSPTVGQNGPIPQPVALVMPIADSLGGTFDDLAAPVVQAVNPIVQPTLRTTDPMLETVSGTVDGLVAAVEAVSPVVKPALATTAPVTRLLEPGVLEATVMEPAAPTLGPPIPAPLVEAMAAAAGPIPSPEVRAGEVESSAKPRSRPAPTGSVASNDDATGVAEGGQWPSEPAPTRRAESPAPASTATSAAPSSRDLPDRTHDAMATATALAHAATPGALAPLGIGVVGASENSGSRPSATPD